MNVSFVIDPFLKTEVLERIVTFLSLRDDLPADFRLADDRSHCVCPAGKHLYSNGSNCTINGYVALKFSGAKQDCVPCGRHQECLRTPDKTQTRQISFLQGKRDTRENHIELMKAKIDSDAGREMITRRFAMVEPVFGNLRGNRLQSLSLADCQNICFS